MKIYAFVVTYFVFGIAAIYSSSTKKDKYLNKDRIIIDLKIVNIFSDCNINVINFCGIDIDFSIFNTPIVFLRYFSFEQNSLQFPYELSPVQFHSPNNWISESFVKKIDNHFEISRENQTIQLDFEIGLNYSRLLYSRSFRQSLIHTSCETNICLHPENIESNPFLYFNHENLEIMLKDPFWIHNKEKWASQVLNQFNSIPKYSILICQADQIFSTCFNTNDITSWLTAVLGFPVFVRMFELRLILQTSLMGQQLFVHCPYCNHCDPLKMLSILTIPNTRESLHQTKSVVTILNARPADIKIELMGYISDYDIMIHNKEMSRQTLFKYHYQYDLSRTLDLAYLADLQLFSHFLADNITLYFYKRITFGVQRWADIRIRSCTLYTVRYHPKLQPSMIRDNAVDTSHYQDAGLVFRNKQLRFVSCHKEQAYWMSQLKELVVVFDISIWFFIILLSVMASQLLPYINHSSVIGITDKQFANCSTYFHMYAMMLDQSAILSSSQPLRKRAAFCFAFVFFPLGFMILGNYYKGDNITRLTLGPALFLLTRLTV